MTGLEAFFLSMVINIIVAALTMKDGPAAKKYALSEFSIPTASEERAQSIGFGTFQVAGNVIYYGNLRTREMTKEIDVFFGLMSSTVSLGYEYSMTLWQSLCGVTCDEITEIRLGDDVIWAGSLPLSRTAATVLNVNKRFAKAEGQEVLDGMEGSFTFFNYAEAEGASDASFTPPANTLMDTLTGGGPVPAYPNTLHVVWDGVCSTGPNLSPMTFTVRRKPAIAGVLLPGMTLTYPLAGTIGITDTDPVRAAALALIASTADVGGDANPAHAELELLTTRVPGVGAKLSPWGVDISSYLYAAQVYKNEGLGVSFAWEVSRPMSEVVKDLMALTYSTRETDELTGQVRTRLIRENDAPVMTYDASNIIEVSSFKRADPTLNPNLVTVPFIDRAAGWIERLAIAKNPAGVRAAGKQLSYRAELIGVSRPALASMLAHREARKFASPLATTTFSGFAPEGRVLKPFELIVFKHPTNGQVLRMRVATIRFATYDGRNSVDVEAIEDVFRGGYAGAVTLLPAPSPVVSAPPTGLTSPVAGLAPYALTGDDADHALYIANDPGQTTSRYSVAYQARPVWDNAQSPKYASGTTEPAIAGTLNSAVLSTASAISPTFTLSDDAVEQWSCATRGQVYLLAGTEWMSCSSWTLAGNQLTANSVLRGIFDTAPAAMAAGSTVRILLGMVVIPPRVKTVPGGGATSFEGVETLVMRAESRGPGGILPVNSAASSQVQYLYNAGTARAARPLSPGNVVMAGVYGARDATETPPNIPRGSAYTLTFTNRNRLSRGVSSWFNTSGEPEPGTVVRALLQHENPPGSWNTVSDTTGTANAATLQLQATSLPAGARVVRLRLETRRTTPAGYLASEFVYSYFYVTS